MSGNLELEDRRGLPEALLVLLEAYPRSGWQAHENFGGLVQFWLERHVMFRRIVERIDAEALEVIEGRKDLDGLPRTLGSFGNLLINQLHHHHMIEDHHYFPKLQVLEPGLARAFEILDADHHALDHQLERFAASANQVAEGGDRESVERFRDTHQILVRLLDRHLLDEEEVVVPVVLKFGEVEFDQGPVGFASD